MALLIQGEVVEAKTVDPLPVEQEREEKCPEEGRNEILLVQQEV